MGQKGGICLRALLATSGAPDLDRVAANLAPPDVAFGGDCFRLRIGDNTFRSEGRRPPGSQHGDSPM